jgi:glycosyltransferase involved in cell wall biosynthesis
MKVLYVCHNHPAVRPGGAEGYAFELYEHLRETGGLTPIFLARTGPPVSAAPRPHEGTIFATVPSDPGQAYFYTDVSDYDWLFGRSPRKDTLTRDFRDFLLAHRPDVVHFQHTFFIGYDILRVTREALPDVPIVYTLHEYLPICHRIGQLVRTTDETRCEDPSSRRCHECFPEISPQTFFMRKRFVQSHFAVVDRFITASRYALERYVDWGIPRERINAEMYGRRPIHRVAATPGRRQRNHIGFFGQLNAFKGLKVLFDAMDLLGPDFDGHLYVHGGNLDVQPEHFQDEFTRLERRNRRTVTVGGTYGQADLPSLMENIDWVVVPSVWCETGPLVVQEAFQHGRPVICSDIGGMAERVEDGVSGLHFRAGDQRELAAALERAVTEPGLWDRLRAGIPEVHAMSDHVDFLMNIYTSLVSARSGTWDHDQAVARG